MSQQTPTLAAAKRERVGSRYAQRERQAGRLPAVVYGHGQEPVAVTIDAHEATKLIHKGEKVFNLDLEGQTEMVLLRDIGYGHLGDNILHADFARVNIDERVDVKVSIRLAGEAKGLRETGAVLVHQIAELELNVLVTNLPDHVEVDVSGLGVGDAIHARDVKLPLDTMELRTDPDAVVAQVVLKKVQEEDVDTGEGAEVSGAAAQPEVIGEKKDGADKGE